MLVEVGGLAVEFVVVAVVAVAGVVVVVVGVFGADVVVEGVVLQLACFVFVFADVVYEVVEVVVVVADQIVRRLRRALYSGGVLQLHSHYWNFFFFCGCYVCQGSFVCHRQDRQGYPRSLRGHRFCCSRCSVVCLGHYPEVLLNFSSYLLSIRPGGICF